jgi:CheY-like chemotaxis protein
MRTTLEAIGLLKTLALSLGAEISETSTADQTTLAITLPRVMRTVSAATDNASIPALRRVLHVEDGDRAADLTHYYLRSLYTVDAAQNAEEALRMALDTPYDVILMDMDLGRGMNGFQLTELLRHTDQYATVPIIALTGYTSKKDVARCVSAGCTAYLSKPFLKEDLLLILKNIEENKPVHG